MQLKTWRIWILILRVKINSPELIKCTTSMELKFRVSSDQFQTRFWTDFVPKSKKIQTQFSRKSLIWWLQTRVWTENKQVETIFWTKSLSLVTTGTTLVTSLWSPLVQLVTSDHTTMIKPWAGINEFRQTHQNLSNKIIGP